MSNFDFAGNPTIYILIFTCSGLNILTLLFAHFRLHRRLLQAARDGRKARRESRSKAMHKVQARRSVFGVDPRSPPQPQQQRTSCVASQLFGITPAVGDETGSADGPEVNPNPNPNSPNPKRLILTLNLNLNLTRMPSPPSAPPAPPPAPPPRRSPHLRLRSRVATLTRCRHACGLVGRPRRGRVVTRQRRRGAAAFTCTRRPWRPRPLPLRRRAWRVIRHSTGLAASLPRKAEARRRVRRRRARWRRGRGGCGTAWRCRSAHWLLTTIPTAHCYYSLLTAHCSLLTTYCPLFIAHCLLLTTTYYLRLTTAGARLGVARAGKAGGEAGDACRRCIRRFA